MMADEFIDLLGQELALGRWLAPVNASAVG
jgi:hypothetical protein